MNNKKILQEISLKYGSDQIEHGYINTYESYFSEIKDKKLKIY